MMDDDVSAIATQEVYILLKLLLPKVINRVLICSSLFKLKGKEMGKKFVRFHKVFVILILFGFSFFLFRAFKVRID